MRGENGQKLWTSIERSPAISLGAGAFRNEPPGGVPGSGTQYDGSCTDWLIVNHISTGSVAGSEEAPCYQSSPCWLNVPRGWGGRAFDFTEDPGWGPRRAVAPPQSLSSCSCWNRRPAAATCGYVGSPSHWRKTPYFFWLSGSLAILPLSCFFFLRCLLTLKHA